MKNDVESKGCNITENKNNGKNCKLIQFSEVLADFFLWQLLFTYINKGNSNFF